MLTAGVNGKHSSKSKHWEFLAWDLRVWNDYYEPSLGRKSPEDCETLAGELRKLLGSNFDVVVHYVKDKRSGAMYVSHIHVEYDP